MSFESFLYKARVVIFDDLKFHSNFCIVMYKSVFEKQTLSLIPVIPDIYLVTVKTVRFRLLFSFKDIYNKKLFIKLLHNFSTYLLVCSIYTLGDPIFKG